MEFSTPSWIRFSRWLHNQFQEKERTRTKALSSEQDLNPQWGVRPRFPPPEGQTTTPGTYGLAVSRLLSKFGRFFGSSKSPFRCTSSALPCAVVVPCWTCRSSSASARRDAHWRLSRKGDELLAFRQPEATRPCNTADRRQAQIFPTACSVRNLQTLVGTPQTPDV